MHDWLISTGPGTFFLFGKLIDIQRRFLIKISQFYKAPVDLFGGNKRSVADSAARAGVCPSTARRCCIYHYVHEGRPGSWARWEIFLMWSHHDASQLSQLLFIVRDIREVDRPQTKGISLRFINKIYYSWNYNWI